MKKLLFTFIMMLSLSLNAQNYVTVYGNVGVQNVNISVLNTEYGTSSDNKSDYKLVVFKSESIVNLSFTCIGYHDTLVSITPKMFMADSVEISFKMKKIIYDLPEASVTATKDFYRSRPGNVIVDIAFVDDKTLILENRKSKTEIFVVDKDGKELSRNKYDSTYNQIFTDAFGNYILLGKATCQQIFFDEKYNIKPVTTFSRQVFRDKLQNCMFEFGNAFIFRNKTVEPDDFYLRADHNQSQTYFYILKNDTVHEKRFLVKFIDIESMKACQSYFNEIVSKYYQHFAEEGIENENEILTGVWNGNMLRLAVDYGLHVMVAWYCCIQAVELHTTAVKTDTSAYFIDLDRYRIVEIDTNFNIKNRYPLKIQSGEKQFKNQFVTDNATGKSYGLFLKDGIYYIGLFDAAQGSVNMTTRASNYIYPKVLKINGGYSYGAYFDVDKQRSFINRVRVD